MEIKKVIFEKSSPNIENCPKGNLYEIAFIGRSNVGKSSLINTLTGSKKLAKISGTPGKTLLINHFIINNNWYLVDLPGFGYAKASKKEKRKIEEIISNYFYNRGHINLTYLLIDSRLKPQNIDIEFMLWLNENNLLFKLIFTKSDKLNKKEIEINPENYLLDLYEKTGIQPEYFISSSKTKLGREAILKDISSEIEN